MYAAFIGIQPPRSLGAVSFLRAKARRTVILYVLLVRIV